MNRAFAIGFIIMFGQALYIDHKLNRNYEKQYKRITGLEIRVDDLATRVENIAKTLEECKNRILK